MSESPDDFEREVDQLAKRQRLQKQIEARRKQRRPSVDWRGVLVFLIGLGAVVLIVWTL